MQGLDFLLKNIYIPVWMYSVWGTHPSVVSAAAPAPTPFAPSAPPAPALSAGSDFEALRDVVDDLRAPSALSAPALSAGSDFEALRVVVDDLRARVAALEVQLQETKETLSKVRRQ